MISPAKQSTRLLIIGYVWPEPRSSAAGAHMMQLIEQFQAQGWKVIFASPAQPSETRADLKVLGIAEKTIALNCSSFDEWVKELNPDIVLFDRFMMEEQFGWRVAEQCPHALRALETSDLHCLREARHSLLKQLPKEPLSKELSDSVPYHSFPELYATMATQDSTQRELASIYRCDVSLLVSDVENNLLIEQFKVPPSLLCYNPFMLDKPEVKNWPSFNERKDFITIGNFLHTPNWDSVLWLKQSIWPLIKEKLPEANLFIYGAYTPQKALDLHNPKQGFHIMGWAEDAMQVMQQARVCLAALRFGAGIKGKLADAMLCGTPSVTTSMGSEAMGNEGMNMKGMWSGLVENSAEAFAKAAVQLYQDEQKWLQSQKNGLAIVQSRFNKQQRGNELIQQIQWCRDNLEQHRRNNFTGLMLQHHSHKSTHYMARWIEAKNKNEAEKTGKL